MTEAIRYGAFTVRTECRHCGQPVPLHGPATEVTCSYCLHDVKVPVAIWRSILEAFDEGHEQIAAGRRHTKTFQEAGFRVNLEVAKQAPACEKCHNAFAVDALPVGSDHDFACTHCGDLASTHPAPSWLRQVVPTARQYYSTEPGAGSAPAGATPVQAPAAPRPVVMNCPQCSGSLQITSDDARIRVCQYCNSDVYLPDEIWRRLHPVKVVQTWYMRFEGPTKADREAELEARRRAEIAAADAVRRERASEAKIVADREKDEKIAGLTATAWLFALTHALFGMIVLAFVWVGPLMWNIDFADKDLGLIIGVFVVGFVFTIVTTLFVGRPIKARTGYDSDWMIFCTWFWLPFAMTMPVVGQIMALVRSVVLFRGKFGSASITTNNTSTRSYDAIEMPRGESRPAGMMFLVIALAWPLMVLGVAYPQALYDVILQAM